MNYMIDRVTSAISPHQHNVYEIVVCTGGNGVFCGTEAVPISRGSIVIVPPGITHTSVAQETLDRIYIEGDFAHCFPFASSMVVRDNAAGEGCALAEILYRNRYAKQEYVAALVEAFVQFLMQNIHTKNRIHTAVTHIINQITAGFQDYSLDLQSLLEASGYAEDYIRAQFKVITGKTPHAFLTDVRIRHARLLMYTYGKSVSLTEVAEKCGFTDYVYFSKKFKAVTGIAPRTYIAYTFGHNDPT
jgi:AraC-like DNA-binding protein